MAGHGREVVDDLGALEATMADGGSREAVADLGRRWRILGAVDELGRRPRAATNLGRRRCPQREASEREIWVGEVRAQVRDPCGAWGAGMGRGEDFWASPALPTCEARIELLNRAGLRALLGAKWALPRWA
jgi:hypothetical protein